MKTIRKTTALFTAALLAVTLLLCGCAKTPQDAAIRSLDASKNLDSATSAALSYSANFYKDSTKEEYIKAWDERVQEVKDNTPDIYADWEKEMGSYKLVEVLGETVKDDEELEEFRNRRSDHFRDAEKITAVERLVFSAARDGDEPQEYAYIMICVDGNWYVGDVDMW